MQTQKQRCGWSLMVSPVLLGPWLAAHWVFLKSWKVIPQIKKSPWFRVWRIGRVIQPGSNPSAARQNLGEASHFLILFSYLFFWLRWVFIAVRRLSPVAASRGYYSLRCVGFSLRWLLLLWSMGSRCTGFGCCGTRALERAGFSSCSTRAQELWLAGSRAQAQ